MYCCIDLQTNIYNNCCTSFKALYFCCITNCFIINVECNTSYSNVQYFTKSIINYRLNKI